jgi:hypothetical protein
MEGLQNDRVGEAEESAETERVVGLVMEAIEDDFRQVAKAILSKRDHELLGPGEFDLRDRVFKAACHVLEAAINDRKKGVPRQQHELSSLRRRRAFRRMAGEKGREPCRPNHGEVCLLSLFPLWPRLPTVV